MERAQHAIWHTAELSNCSHYPLSKMILTSWRAPGSLSQEDRHGISRRDVKAMVDASTCKRWTERAVDTRGD